MTLGCSAQRLPTPGPEMAPAGAKEPPAEASSGASGRAQKHRSEEAGLGSPSVGTGHTLRDGHNPGSGGEQAGNSAPQTDVSFEEAGRCVGCSGPAGPLLGRDSTATLSWGHSQTHPTSPWGSRPQEEEGTELRAASWPLRKADQACTLSLPQDRGHRQAVGGHWRGAEDWSAWEAREVGGPFCFLDSCIFTSCSPGPYWSEGWSNGGPAGFSEAPGLPSAVAPPRLQTRQAHL